MVKDNVFLKTVQTSIYVVNNDWAESQSSRVCFEHWQGKEKKEKKEWVSGTQRFSELICELVVHKPVCRLCLMIVPSTTGETSDKLHIEKREEFLHEVQRLFIFVLLLILTLS